MASEVVRSRMYILLTFWQQVWCVELRCNLVGGIVLWIKTLSGVCVYLCVCTCTSVCILWCVFVHTMCSSLLLVITEHAGTGDSQDDRRRTTHEPSQGLSPRSLRCHVIMLELHVRKIDHKIKLLVHDKTLSFSHSRAENRPSFKRLVEVMRKLSQDLQLQPSLRSTAAHNLSQSQLQRPQLQLPPPRRTTPDPIRPLPRSHNHFQPHVPIN